MQNQWNSTLYDNAHSFVWKLASDLISVLAPKPGEFIVDLGCGTGHLTSQIAAAGAQVLGMDSSKEMIERARSLHPDLSFEVADARSFQVAEPADAVFSNAALHWVPDAEDVVRQVAAALKPGGRFVAEFGGSGNIRLLLRAVESVCRRHAKTTTNPWYFPTVGVYAPLLEKHGLEVREAFLFDRMTALEEGSNGLRDWLSMFAEPLLGPLTVDERERILAEIEEVLRPDLFFDGRWHVDYRRLRVSAVRLDS